MEVNWAVSLCHSGRWHPVYSRPLWSQTTTTISHHLRTGRREMKNNGWCIDSTECFLETLLLRGLEILADEQKWHILSTRYASSQFLHLWWRQNGTWWSETGNGPPNRARAISLLWPALLVLLLFYTPTSFGRRWRRLRRMSRPLEC